MRYKMAAAKRKKGGDGYYRARYIYDGHVIDVRSLDEKDLDNKIKQKENEIDKGNIVLNAKNITVKTWSEEWLATYKKPFVTEKGYGTYKSIINKHIVPAIGEFKIKEVRALQLQKILTGRAGKSTSHVARVLMTMRALFKQARINGLIYTDPTEGLIMPQTTKGTHRVITDEEKDKLFKSCESFPQKAYIYLMYYCGLRPQETVALNWENVDIEKKILHIRNAVENGKGRKLKSPKSKAGIRDIPMPDELIVLLEPLLGDNDDPVLLTDKGLRGNANACERWWRKIRGLYMEINEGEMASDFTPYCLRHTYCTNLQRAGVALNVAKYLMGHADIKMTANIYGHQTEDQTDAARAKINNFHVSNGVNKQ